MIATFFARLSNPQHPFKLRQLVMAAIILGTLLLLFLTPSEAQIMPTDAVFN